MIKDKLSNSTMMNTTRACQYLGFRESTLNNSRYTGQLGGVASPKYRKLGKAIRYEKSTLDDWISQFEEQSSTSCAEKKL